MTDVTNEQWYLARNGQQSGPLTRDELSAMRQRGELNDTDLVWREGMGDWQPIGGVPEFDDGSIGIAPAPLATAPQATTYAPQPGPLSYYGGPADGFQYVGFWWRVLAYVIDYFVLFIPSAVIGFVAGFLAATVSDNSEGAALGVQAVGNVLGLVIGWLYAALMESSSKQATLGKMAIGCIVTDELGQRLTFGRATGRHFAKILSGLILLVGFMMVGWTQKKQGLHDIIAKTLVVKK
jgi:uncharacterized RDD family membrane protein YckC